MQELLPPLLMVPIVLEIKHPTPQEEWPDGDEPAGAAYLFLPDAGAGWGVIQLPPPPGPRLERWWWMVLALEELRHIWQFVWRPHWSSEREEARPYHERRVERDAVAWALRSAACLDQREVDALCRSADRHLRAPGGFLYSPDRPLRLECLEADGQGRCLKYAVHDPEPGGMRLVGRG